MKIPISQQQLIWIALGLIVVIIASYVRLAHLASLPAGMTWDEAAIGYNGFAIWETRRDEWLQRLPVSFRSFGDYKAPLAIYVSAVFSHLLGLSLFAVRLPFAVAGIITVIGMILLSRKILVFTSFRSSLSINSLAVLSGFIIALSPWHVLFSRVGFESGIALCLMVYSAWLGLLALKPRRRRVTSMILAGISAALLSLTLYTYHSAKIFVPLALILLVIWWIKSGRSKKSLLSYLAVVVVVLLPIIHDSFFGEGLTRAGVSIFSLQLAPLTLLLRLAQNLLAHISPSFIIFGQTDSLRHSTGTWGVLLPTTALLVVFALFSTAFHLFQKKLDTASSHNWKLVCFATLWMLIGLVPAVIGKEVPHPNRALLALPGFMLLAIVGFEWIFTQIQKKKMLLAYGFAGLFIITHGYLFMQFWQYYTKEYQVVSSAEFIDGYQRMFERVWQIHDGKSEYQPVDQILISSEYGQPYIYALFTKKISPIAYHGGFLSRFLFPDKISVGDLLRENTLLVFGPQSTEVDPRLADEIITDLSGQPMFYLIYTGKDDAT